MKQLACGAALLCLAACGKSADAPVTTIAGYGVLAAELDDGNAPPALVEDLLWQRAAEDAGLLTPAVRARMQQAARQVAVDVAQQALLQSALTPAALRAHYDAHKDEFVTTQVHIAQVVVPDGVDAGVVLAALRGGEPFAAVAQRVSADRRSAADGGVLPPSTSSELPAPLFAAAMALAPGEISDVVVVGQQRHVITVLSAPTTVLAPFEAVLPRVRATALQKRRAERLTELATTHHVAMPASLLPSEETP